MSGAGRSTSLKYLEDIGWEAVDNLPLDLIDAVLRSATATQRPLAIGVDIRSRGFAPAILMRTLDAAQAEPGASVGLLFVDCDDEVLRRRFTETRRRHPLAHERPVTDGIVQERALLTSLRARADLVLDTSALATADLKRLLHGHYRLDVGPLRIFLMSFAYRNGLPREADLVFDLRFLANPHYVAELRPLTGREAAVAAHVAADPGWPQVRDGLTGLLTVLLPRYELEGKSYLTIAFGCSGGRHRSVFVTETMAAWLRDQGWRVELAHRELTAEMDRAPDPEPPDTRPPAAEQSA